MLSKEEIREVLTKVINEEPEENDGKAMIVIMSDRNYDDKLGREMRKCLRDSFNPWRMTYLDQDSSVKGTVTFGQLDRTRDDEDYLNKLLLKATSGMVDTVHKVMIVFPTDEIKYVGTQDHLDF